MCGICGLLHFNTDRAVDRTILQKMNDVLSHRGPDGEGFYIDRNIGLGHKRLSIIDLSTGSQPMMSQDQSLVIVFNGEIYNYIELKEELKASGHTFDTSSDTEVILHAYEEWGFDCQQKFNGMWAFALWDARQKQMFLSRDRIGEKPLHFAVRDNSFLFGSEIKSLLASVLTFEKRSDLLHVYLSLGYVPAPHTFYKGIIRLMPGHFLVVKGGQVNEHTYWDLPSVTEGDMRRDARKIYEEFENCFSDSVRIRMRSDVPYGAFLSGGLDSSSIVAAMSQESRSPVETFTIGFAEKSFDERGMARLVAEQFHTNHHEECVEPDTFDESLRKILFHFDEPFGDASATLVGLVSRLARERVTMALTGDGGDEVLSGYTPYRTEKLSEQYRKIPASIRSSLYHTLGLLGWATRNDLRYKVNRLMRFLDLATRPFEERFVSKLALLSPDSIRALVLPDVPQISMDDFLSGVLGKCNFTDPFYRLMYFNLKVSLPDDMLAKVDRMSMAHSLEARVPFLDHRLVELTYTVDKNIKLLGYNLKNVLKQTYGKKLPTSLVKAPKMSFMVPLREWFKQKRFEGRLNELIKSDFGLDSAGIAEIVEANKSSKQDYGDFIWRLFVLKNWTNN